MKFINLIIFLILISSVLALPPSFAKSGLSKPVNLGGDSQQDSVTSSTSTSNKFKEPTSTTKPKYVTQEQFEELKNLISERASPKSSGVLYSLISFIAVISFAGLVTSTYAIKGKKGKSFHEDQLQELVIYFRNHRFQGKNALVGVAARAGWNMKQIDEALREANIL